MGHFWEGQERGKEEELGETMFMRQNSLMSFYMDSTNMKKIMREFILE